MNVRFLGQAALLAALAACADGTAPDAPATPPSAPVTTPDFAVKPADQLHFLQTAADAPPLAELSVSFWAVRGQSREAIIWYHAQAGAPDSAKRARLKVPAKSLVRAPDGTPIAPGDSLLITMTVSDAQHQIVDLEPSGLQFAPGRPATLTLFYLEADHDFNEDGVINRADSTIERMFQIWGQEKAGDPWRSFTTQLSIRLDEAEADIPGFTRYAVAY